MLYDLQAIHETCCRLKLTAVIKPDTLEVHLGKERFLDFKNDGEDSRLEFRDMPWHTHGDIMFANCEGAYVQLDGIAIIEGICAGKILVCERWYNNACSDCWLVHSDYNDALREVESGEELRIWRV